LLPFRDVLVVLKHWNSGALVDTELGVKGLGNEVEGFLDEALANYLEDRVLLEGHTRDVELREIVRVDDTRDEVEVLGVDSDVLQVVHGKGTADVELNVAMLPLGIEAVEGALRVDQ
jgi:hypothetical protein